MKIELFQNKGTSWYSLNNIHVKGYIFDEANNFINEEALCNYFSNASSLDQIKEKLLSANGSFAVVSMEPNMEFVAVDRLRSIPIFFLMEAGNCVSISDSISHAANDSIDSVSVLEYLSASYVPGCNTLYENHKQLCAGEILLFGDSEYQVERYYSHYHNPINGRSEQTYFAELEGVTKNISGRLIESAQGRQLVVPLSGGYDSRYIVSLLVKSGYKNILCYTYGIESSYEVRIAREVCRSLGVNWEFIEYQDSDWERYSKSTKVLEFYDYTINGVACPHVQEFIAIEKLLDKELVNSASIFVPGFCGDLLGGSYVPAKCLESATESKLLGTSFVDYIFNEYLFIGNKLNVEETESIKSRLSETLNGKDYAADMVDFVSTTQDWFTREKASKYVMNSLRVYEYFGFEWRTVLWDNELAEYWYSVPIAERVNNPLYERYLFENMFNPLDVGVRKPEFRDNSRLRMLAKTILPRNVSLHLRSLYHRLVRKKHDINAFSYLHNKYDTDLKEIGVRKLKSNRIQQIVSAWVIHKHLKIPSA